jgi:hypothetical protein
MMEGISNEACSLAGHWGLGKLIALYDDNNISIDGHTEISFTEDVSKRFEALGWHVQHVKDGNTDFDSLRKVGGCSAAAWQGKGPAHHTGCRRGRYLAVVDWGRVTAGEGTAHAKCVYFSMLSTVPVGFSSIREGVQRWTAAGCHAARKQGVCAARGVAMQPCGSGSVTHKAEP